VDNSFDDYKLEQERLKIECDVNRAKYEQLLFVWNERC